MSNEYFQTKQDPSIESLMQRYKLFKLIESSYLRWMHETTDSNIKELHHALADQFQVVLEQYELLLDALQDKHSKRNWIG
jgi:hypothetical protein